MPRYDKARWRPVTRYDVGGAYHVAMTPRRLTLHTAVSAGTSLFDLFNTSGNPVAHFYVDGGGDAEQYVDTSYRSSAVLEGNHDSITVESWDNYPHGWRNGGDVPDWTDAQIQWIAELAVWVNKTHSIPLVQLPSSRPGTTGIGWHRQGIDGNFAGGILAGRVSGGERWSPSAGKSCPGDRKIHSIVSTIIPRAIALSTGDEPMTPDDLDKIGALIDDKLAPIEKALATFRTNIGDRDHATVARDEALGAQLDAIHAAVTSTAPKGT